MVLATDTLVEVTIDSAVMADDSKHSSDKDSKPSPSENKAAQDRGQDSVKLSIEEKAMQVMPVTPDPQGHVEVGGLPTNEGGGGGEGGGSEGGGDSGGGSSSSDSSE